MSWVRLDDKFADHPKVIRLSDKAFRIHVWAMCYCAQHSPGIGHFPVAALKGKATASTIDELVKARLWDRLDDDDLAIHDFEDYNPKPGDKAEAGRRGGIASGEARRSKREALASGLLHEATHEAPEAKAQANRSSRAGARAEPPPLPHPHPREGDSYESPSQPRMLDEAFGSVMTALIDIGVSPSDRITEQVRFRLDSGMPAEYLVEAIGKAQGKGSPWDWAAKVADRWWAEGKPKAANDSPRRRFSVVNDPEYAAGEPDLDLLNEGYE